MKIRDVLAHKGHEVVTIEPHRTVLEAVRTLVEHNIGSVVVTDGGRPAGILTERDVLRLTAGSAGALDDTTVADAMTRELITSRPDDEVHEIMAVMTERRIRHLPVVEEERLAGIVSIGDLVNACLRMTEEENQHLRAYIQGVG